MEVISIRVPKELKEEMRRLHVDWGDYVRQALEERVRMEKIRRACETIDELRQKTKGVKFDSVKVIREARDSR